MEYVDISMDFDKYIKKTIDIRVPKNITVKELLQIISESYSLPIKIDNPSIRIEGFGVILTSFNMLSDSVYVRDGSLLIIENI
ncbi:hypothetical protein [Gemella cuniculi]|uniref:hypothetical protein n=1 Tax=Gemella cuniculi TaxID=150240 RepID=UPI0003F6956A|nr:hypothetical protein [Gemella cuniculi]